MTAKRARYAITSAAIPSNRSIGSGLSDEMIAKKHGYRDLNEYWADAMSQEVSALKFAEMLYDHQQAPLQRGYSSVADALKRRIFSTMRAAVRTEKAWLKRDRMATAEFDDNLKHWRVDARGAAEWWMRQRLDVDLLPASLRAYLGCAAAPIKPIAVGRRGGRPRSKSLIIESWLASANVKASDTDTGLAGAFIAAQPENSRAGWSESSVRRLIGKIRINPVNK